MRALVLIAVLALPAAADPREVFYGTWGTDTQCARAPIKPGGTVLSTPYEINAEWLKHGTMWCRLRWFPTEQRGDSLFSGAFAACGEDSVRSYLLGMELGSETGEFVLRWDLFQQVGPLTRCSSP